jgi:integrase
MKNRKRRGRGEGSVYQRADGLWIASISLGYGPDGKRQRLVVAGVTKKEALEKLEAKRAKVRGGAPLDAERLTVAGYLTIWLENTKKPAVGDTTYDRYEQHCRLTIIPHLGQVLLPKLTKYHVETWYAELQKAGVSRSEQQKAGKALRNALKHAVASDLIGKNPAALVPLPKTAGTRKEVAPLTAREAGLLLRAARRDRFRALYTLALDAGMRQGELFGLSWEDVDFERGEILVRRSLKERKGQLELKETKTKHGRRRVRITKLTLVALHEHRKAMVAEGHGSAPVFCDTEGGWLRKSNFARRSWARVLKRSRLNLLRKRAGKPTVRFHDLRHTCATLLLLDDVSAKVVSERLGHASIEITLNVYSHVLPTLQERAVEKLEGIMGQMVPKSRPAKVG